MAPLAPVSVLWRWNDGLTDLLVLIDGLSFLVQERADLVTDLSLGNSVGVVLIAIITEQAENLVVLKVHLERCLVSLICIDLRGARAITHKNLLLLGDVGDVHVVGGGAEIFVFLAGEDIDGDQMDLGVTVLAGLRGRHINDLAGASLDDNETVLSEGRALGGGG